jgi:hypothetical protein
MNIPQPMRSLALSRFESPRRNQTRPAMKPISEAAGRPLRWHHLGWFKGDYELRAGDETVGTLSFPSLWSYMATATSAEGTWRFKRTGFWRPEIAVRVSGTDTDLAVFGYNSWKNGGSLEFRDGRKFCIIGKSWGTRFEIRSDRDQVLLSLCASPWTGGSAELEVGAEAARLPELTLLLLFSWYLAVLTRDEAAGS